jgi:predicted nucleic acid-binding protein
MTVIDSDYQKPGIAERVETARVERDLIVPLVVAVEIESGRYEAVLKAGTGEQLLLMQDRLLSTRKFLAKFVVLDFDPESATEFEKLKRNKRLGKVGNVDLQIAAVALAFRAKLATRNTRDYSSIPGLQVEDRTKS